MIKNLVTIIIPVYNNVEYLKDSLASVISQTYPYIEIIVVDDGSKKYLQIVKICKQFKKKIKIIKLTRNQGVSTALNKGILASKGQYINWLSHDDLFTPTKIDDQMKLIRGSYNNISITNFIIWDTNKNTKMRSKQQEKDFTNFKENILTRDIFNFCTFLIPRSLFFKNLFNEQLKYTQDYDMMLRLTNKANFSFLNKDLFISRKHSKQGSNIKKKEWISEKNNFYIKNIIFYLELLKKSSIIKIFCILTLLYFKKLENFSLILDKNISKLGSKKIMYINIFSKNFTKVLNVFKALQS
jgi:glycosyltransferase involved in cell wall biosynthesis